MRHPAQVYTRALERLTDQATSREKLTQLLDAFLQFVARNNDLGAMRRVLDAFERQYRRREQIQLVEAEFADPRDRDANRNALKDILGRTLGGFTLRERVRPSLIRGVRLIIGGDIRIDTSLEGAIRKF